MRPQNKTKCHCKAVESAASDSNCPVEFDDTLNEYNIVSIDGRHRYRLYFCWFCGGELPESKRPGLFTTPLAAEVIGMKKEIASIHSAADAVARLGKPDAKYDVDVERGERLSSGVRCQGQLIYASRWRSLVLTVREGSDGSVDFAYTGKHKNQTNGSAPRKRAAKAVSRRLVRGRKKRR